MTEQELEKVDNSSVSVQVGPAPSPVALGGMRSQVGEDRRESTEPGAGAERHGISRRKLLGAMGAVGVAVGLGISVLDRPSVASAAGRASKLATGTTKPLAQWTMIFDLRYCNGCKVCTQACQAAHYLPEETEWIKVYTMTAADGGVYHLPKPCMMCEDPPCQAVCPVGATFRTDEGIVLINQDVCIGCRTCMAACPYESRYFNTPPMPKVPHQPFPTSPEWPVPQAVDTVGKCVWCFARVMAGMAPACVSACTMGVIYIGDLTTDVAVNGKGDVIKISEFLQANDAVRLKEELGTNPRVFYILGQGQDLSSWA